MQYLAVSTWTMYSSHSASNSIHRYFWCLVKLALVVMPMYYWNKAKAATLQLSHLPQFCIVYRWMIEALVTLYNRSPKLPKISPTAQKTNKYTCRGSERHISCGYWSHYTQRLFSATNPKSWGPPAACTMQIFSFSSCSGHEWCNYTNLCSDWPFVWCNMLSPGNCATRSQHKWYFHTGS